MPKHVRQMASKGFEDTSAECARRAIISMKDRKLAGQWYELSRAMSTTELLAKDDAVHSDDGIRERLGKDMDEIMDIFNTLYAFTESILPKPDRSKSSKISDQWELDLYNDINNRLHVMDDKRASFLKAMES